MVDCFDRIAVQMTEIALEPIAQLAKRPTLTAVTVRLTSNGRRVLLTVSKRFAHHATTCSPTPTVGGVPSPTFAWKLEDSNASGQPTGVIAESTPIQRYRQPEGAFWGAVDALRDANLGRLDAG